MQEMQVPCLPGSEKSPGGEQGNPCQHSCLQNPMDRGAWQATIHSVTKSWTQLKQLSTSQAMGRASLGPSREVGLPGHPCTYSPCFLWPRVSSMRLQLSTPSQAMCESILHSTPQHLVPGLGVDRLMGGKPIISLFPFAYPTL